MSNGQYVIPTSHEAEADDARRLVEDVYDVTPEVAQPVTYERFVNVGMNIEELRARATEDILPREKGLLRIPRFFLEPPQSFQERLIEHERVLGGKLLPKIAEVQYFWYHDGGEWFLEVGDKEVTAKTRYIVTETEVIKLFKGRRVHFEEGEHETLLDAITLYDYEIRDSLYER